MRSDVTREWTATTRSARGAALALTRHGLSRRALWLLMTATWMLLTAVLAGAIDDRWSVAVRLLAGAIYASGLLVVIIAFISGVALCLNLHLTRQRLVPGTVWKVTATAEDVTMSGPLNVRATVPHAAWSVVRVRGDWVLTQQRGVPIVSAWPRSLFPDETLALMEVGRGARGR